VMGRSDGRNVRERELLALMAAQSHNEREPARAGD